MLKLNKDNVHLFAQKKPLRSENDDVNEDIKYLLDTNKYQNYTELLQRCERSYTALEEFRSNRNRNIRYLFGKQDLDLIKDPDSYYQNVYITEREYMHRRGVEPSKYNIIGKSVKTILGLYQNNKPEPRANARNTEDRVVSDMMSVGLQYTQQREEVEALDSSSLWEALISGTYILSQYYGTSNETGAKPNVLIYKEDPQDIFFTSDLKDPRMRDVTMIGVIRDMSLGSLLQKFARSKKDAVNLRKEYDQVVDFVSDIEDRVIKGERLEISNTSFYHSKPGKCRVYEIWNKETKQSYSYHDYSTGEYGYFENKDLKSVIAENESRKQQLIELGYPPESAPLIEYEYCIRSIWCFYYLTPLGNCILSGESPYEHKEHPFTLSFYPLIAAEVRSPVDDLVDIQKQINRVMTQMDLMRQHSARGLWMVPEDCVPEDMTDADFVSQLTSIDGVVMYSPNNSHGQIPQQIKTNSVQMSDIETIRLFMNLNDEISGISDALRGESPNSGTPAALYQQQAANSSVNIADFMGWYNRANTKMYTKTMHLIKQYWDSKMYINLSGKDYNEDAKHFDPRKITNIDYDVSVTQVGNNPSISEAIDTSLREALQQGYIDFKTYLESSNLPYATKVLDILNSKEQQNEKVVGSEVLEQAQLPAGNEQIMNEFKK